MTVQQAQITVTDVTRLADTAVNFIPESILRVITMNQYMLPEMVLLTGAIGMAAMVMLWF